MSRDSQFRPPPFPREHGAWAMLVIPLLLGLAVGRALETAALLLLPAMTFLFLSRYAALPAAARLIEGKPALPGYLARRFFWTGIYLSGCLACFLGALAQTAPGARRAALGVAVVTVLLGGAQTVAALAGRGRSLWAELLGMAGLASAAPLVAAVSGHPVDARALGAALLALAYFVSSLVFVRAYRARARGEARAAVPCLAAHAVLGALLALLWMTGFIPAGALAAFIPVFTRTAWGLMSPPKNIRALGWSEVAVALLFTGMVLAALAL